MTVARARSLPEPPSATAEEALSARIKERMLWLGASLFVQGVWWAIAPVARLAILQASQKGTPNIDNGYILAAELLAWLSMIVGALALGVKPWANWAAVALSACGLGRLALSLVGLPGDSAGRIPASAIVAGAAGALLIHGGIILLAWSNIKLVKVRLGWTSMSSMVAVAASFAGIVLIGAIHARDVRTAGEESLRSQREVNRREEKARTAQWRQLPPLPIVTEGNVADRPSDPYLRVNYGNQLADKGDLDAAVAQYSKALELAPKLPWVRCNRGKVYALQGNLDSAIADYLKAIETDPDPRHAYFALAWIHATAAQGQYRNGPRALELVEKALAIDRAHLGPHDLLAIAAAQARAGKFDVAVGTAEQALRWLKEDGLSKDSLKFEAVLQSLRAGKPYEEPPPAKGK